MQYQIRLIIGNGVVMETRKLGRTGLEVGVIGLGVEHMSMSRKDMDAVIDVAVSAGVSYIDLVYHEPIDHCQRCFDQVLQQLGNGYAEIAMLTMVDSETLWKNWAQESIQRLKRSQREGRIGYIGLSNHNIDVARIAVESHLIDVLMFPVNLYQHHGHQERIALLDTCTKHRVGVVAMKPYHGGRLISTQGRPTGVTPTQCLQYALSQPVSTTVPGPQDANCRAMRAVCVERCPFEVDIIGKMRRAVEVFETT